MSEVLDAVLEEIRDVVLRAMPSDESVLDVVHGALVMLPVPVPRGSHLMLTGADGRVSRGHDVVAIRNTNGAMGRAEALTGNGKWVPLGDLGGFGESIELVLG